MSSHHIVTDNQEPAILVTDERFNTSVLEGLLEWGSRLIVNFPALERIIHLGIKVDEVICLPEEQEQVAAMLHHQFPHFKIFIRQQEPIELSTLHYLQASGLTSFNILTTLEKVFLHRPLYALKGELVIYKENSRCIFIDEQASFGKWLLKDVVLRVLPIDDNANTLNIENLEEIEINTYKVIETGMVTIKVLEGEFLVGYGVV